MHPRLSAERRCLFVAADAYPRAAFARPDPFAAAKEPVRKSKRMIVTGRTRRHANRWALATIMSDGMAGPETGL